MIDAVASIERRDAAGGRGRATRRDEGLRAVAASDGSVVAPLRPAPPSWPRHEIPLVAVAQIRWKVL